MSIVIDDTSQSSYSLGIVGLGRRSDLALRLVCNSLDVEPLPAVVVEVFTRPGDPGDCGSRSGREGEDRGEEGGVEQHFVRCCRSRLSDPIVLSIDMVVGRIADLLIST